MMPAMHGDLWQALGPLEAEVEAYELEPRELETPGFVRHSTTVAVAGAGVQGRGEDVSYSPDDQQAHRRLEPLPLRGRRTLAGWSALLDECDLFPEDTTQHAARDYRRWAYESALLDLALGQAGVTLGQAVGRPYAPVRFVVSSNADPGRWLELYPGVELKVDAGAAWGRADFERLAALGVVRVVDIKGQYGSDYPQGERDEAGLVAMAAEILPDAIIEDPSTEPQVLPAIAAAADRISFDAPVHAVADLAALPPVRHLNVKPSRFGTRRAAVRMPRPLPPRGDRDVRRRPVRARRRPGPDPGAREPVLSRRPERLRAGRLQRARAHRRPSGQPARRVGLARHDRVLSAGEPGFPRGPPP